MGEKRSVFEGRDVSFSFGRNMRNVFDARDVFDLQVLDILQELGTANGLDQNWRWGWDTKYDGDDCDSEEHKKYDEIRRSVPLFQDQWCRVYRFEYSPKEKYWAAFGIGYDPGAGGCCFFSGVETLSNDQVFARAAKEAGFAEPASHPNGWEVARRPPVPLDQLTIARATEEIKALKTQWQKFQEALSGTATGTSTKSRKPGKTKKVTKSKKKR